MNSKKRTFVLYAASLLIPAALLLASLAFVGAVPFGRNSIIWQDAEIQYIDFFNYLRTIFSGENDLLYSFSKNLGGEMVSLLSYYLMSPFNLLFAFASDNTLPLVYTIVAVLKLSVCGLTFFHASVKLYGCKSIHLAFSTAYALMAYNVIYCWSVMWLDGVLILPLLGLGIYDLWRGKAPWCYVLSLGYGLLTNFYIGYMLCIASVLFSLIHMLLMEGNLHRKAAAFGRFLGASCIGGLSSAFLWLPAFLGLLGGRAKFDGNTTNILFNFNVLGLAGKLTAGSASPTQVVVGTPHIFCGMLVLFLVLLFFLNRGIAGKVRLAVLGVLAVLFVSFVLRPINIIWHGFSPNYAFNFRYAFLFSYVMIMAAQYSLTWADKADRWALVLVAGLLVTLIVGLLAVRNILKLDYLSTVGCGISFAVVAVVFLLLTFPGKKSALVCPALILLGVVEMGANCCLSWENVVSAPGFGMVQTASYEEFTRRTGAAVDYVKELDSGFYRMEKDFHHDKNDSMYFDYNGLSHFSSSQQKQVLGLLEKLGFKNYLDIWAAYHSGSTAEVDSLLGVKYLLSEKDMTAAKGYELLATVEEIGVYRNPNAMPIAMLSGEAVGSVDMAQKDYFALHNAIWQSISGEEVPVLEKASYTMTLENLFAMPLGDGTTRYIRTDETQPAALRFEIPVTREAPLYYYFTSTERQDASIRINGVDNGLYFHDSRWDMTNAGIYAVGDVVTIEVVLLLDQIVIRDALFYYEDLTALSSHAAAVMEQSVEVIREASSRLSGSFAAQKGQVLLFTIPYDTGWRLYVDGEKTDYAPVLDSLMAASVSEGQHTFALRYVPRGAGAGCGLSVCAVLAAALWLLADRRKKRNI